MLLKQETMTVMIILTRASMWQTIWARFGVKFVCRSQCTSLKQFWVIQVRESCRLSMSIDGLCRKEVSRRDVQQICTVLRKLSSLDPIETNPSSHPRVPPTRLLCALCDYVVATPDLFWWRSRVGSDEISRTFTANSFALFHGQGKLL